MRCCKTYKVVWTLFGVLLLCVMALYFYLSPSYRKTFEAKYYYSTGDYIQALNLSREALVQNSYNNMAITIMTRSKISLAYIRYIDQAKIYMKDIRVIAQHKELSPADKAKMKLMAEIVIGDYKHLLPNAMINEDLVKQAEFYFHEFKKLHAKITALL